METTGPTFALVSTFQDVTATSRDRISGLCRRRGRAAGRSRLIILPGLRRLHSARDRRTYRSGQTGRRKGLATLRAEGGRYQSPIAKFLSEAEIAAAHVRHRGQRGDLVLHRCRSARCCRQNATMRFATRWAVALVWPIPTCSATAGSSISHCLNGTKKNSRWDSPHNPFCGFIEEDRPNSIRSRQYPLQAIRSRLNGNEVGGGSVRNHRRADQAKSSPSWDTAEAQRRSLRRHPRRARLRRSTARRHRHGRRPLRHDPG